MLDKNLKKSFIWNTLGSGLLSVNSLFFLIIATRINGVSSAGIFSVCYATACMLYCVAIYSGRIYQVTETDDIVTDNEYIVNRIITSIVMLLLTILFGFINSYNNYKLSILFILALVKAIEAFSDVFHGILQKNERLDIVGKSLLLRSTLNVICFLIVNLITENLLLSCISLVIVNILVLIFIDIKVSLKYKEKEKHLNLNGVFRIFTFGFFTFAFTLISNYLVNIPRYAIDTLNTESLQTIFGIIVMPATVIMLVCQFITQPIIVKLKQFYLDNNKKAFLSIIYKVIVAIIIIGIMALIAGYLLGIPVLNFMYGIKLEPYLSSLLITMIAVTMYTISSIFSQAMVIFRKTKAQFYIYLFVSLASYIICNYLISIVGFNGAIYGYLISMTLLLLLYIIYFISIIGKVFIKKIN